MKIDQLDISAYGIFNDFRVQDLSSGLNVFWGPNEAGKSTLVSFIRGVLFGFPDGRSSENRYLPVSGGRHGGKIVASVDGEEIAIERYVGRGEGVSIVVRDGAELDDASFRARLGGADSTLFSAVFAISLSELESLKKLEDDRVRDRVFSAGILGAGRDAKRVIRMLSEQSKVMLRRRGKNEVDQLIQQLDEKQRELNEAQSRAQEYSNLLDAEVAAVEHVLELKAVRKDANRALATTKLLLELWHVRLEEQDVSRELEQVGPCADDELLAQIEESYLGLELHRNREQRLAGLKETAKLAERRCEDETRSLGSDWSRERIDSFEISFADRERMASFQGRIARAERDLENSERVLLESEQELRDFRKSMEELLRERSKYSGRNRVEIEAEKTRLHQIQDLVSEQVHLKQVSENLLQKHGGEHRAETQASRRYRRLLTLRRVVLFLVCGIAIAICAYSILAKFSLLLTSVAVFSMVALLFGLRYSGFGDAQAELVEWSAERQKTAQELARVEQDNDELVQRLGDLEPELARLGSLESVLADVKFRTSNLAREEEALRAFEAEIEQARFEERRGVRIQERGERAKREHRVAQEGLERASSEWQDWCLERGFPDQLSPASLLVFVDRIERVQHQLQEIEKTMLEVRRLEGDSEAFLSGLASILSKLEEETSDGDVLKRFVQARERMHRARELVRRLVELSRERKRRVGSGEEAQRIETELASGEVTKWQDEVHRYQTTLAEVEQELESAQRRVYEIEREKLELEESSDVVTRAMELDSLREELGQVMRRWMKVQFATELIERTLGEYTKTRQPAVLEEASRTFSLITRRYDRISQVDAADGRLEIAVTEKNGARKSTDQLSRGTLEQLYLSLRLGLAEEFSRRAISLPMVLDDVLVNFDPSRAKRLAEGLSDFAKRHQVLLFTCQPSTRELFREVDPEANIVSLEQNKQPGGGVAELNLPT